MSNHLQAVMDRAKQLQNTGIAYRAAVTQAWKEYRDGSLKKKRMGSVGKVLKKSKAVKKPKPVKKVVKKTTKTERYSTIGAIAHTKIGGLQQDIKRYEAARERERTAAKKKGLTPREKAGHVKAALDYTNLIKATKSHLSHYKKHL